MSSIIVGDPTVLAIESSITEPYSNLSLRVLGYFLIHLGGREYGVRSADATMLACSFDAVERRISRRGTHSMSVGSYAAAGEIVDAFLATTYDMDRQDEHFFGMSCDEFRDNLALCQIVWAPDGDAAFDDGSHVLQFDSGEHVRLIAFKNEQNLDDVARTLTEVWVNSNMFYALLDEWRSGFEVEWCAASKAATK